MSDFVAFLFALFSHVVPLPNKGVISKSSCVSVLYIESCIRVQHGSTLNCYLYAQTLCGLSQVLCSLYSDNTTILLGCCPFGAIICFYICHFIPFAILTWLLSSSSQLLLWQRLTLGRLMVAAMVHDMWLKKTSPRRCRIFAVTWLGYYDNINLVL